MVNYIVQHSPDDFGCFLVDFGPIGEKKGGWREDYKEAKFKEGSGSWLER